MLRRRDRSKQAGRLETLGSWLGIWTTARDVEVRPRPGPRALGLGAAALIALGALVAVTIVPAIDRAKRSDAAREGAQSQRLARTRAAQARAEQRARRGPIPAAAGRASARRLVERAILADARRRFVRRAASTDCRPYLGGSADGERVDKYACTAATSAIPGGRGTLGIPYNARVDRGARRYAFCKINPVPGERGLPDPRRVVELPAACRLRE